MGRSHRWAKSQISNPKLGKQVNMLIFLEKRPGHGDSHLTFAAIPYSESESLTEGGVLLLCQGRRGPCFPFSFQSSVIRLRVKGFPKRPGSGDFSLTISTVCF
jgi:hypothetical protein